VQIGGGHTGGPVIEAIPREGRDDESSKRLTGRRDLLSPAGLLIVAPRPNGPSAIMSRSPVAENRGAAPIISYDHRSTAVLASRCRGS
jgi:hypothetical protein